LYRVGKIADKALMSHAFRLRRRVALSLLARTGRPTIAAARDDVLVEATRLSAFSASL
jgi:hypothetical protein